MNFNEKIEIPVNKYPENDEYKTGGPAMYISGNGLRCRELPLSQFKKNSKFRIYGENILKQYNYDPNEYTLILHHEPEWFNYFTLAKRLVN